MVRRFNHELGLKDDGKADFKIKAIAFVNSYVALPSTHYSEIKKWEYLFWFLKLLLLKLETRNLDEDMLERALLDRVGG